MSPDILERITGEQKHSTCRIVGKNRKCTCCTQLSGKPPLAGTYSIVSELPTTRQEFALGLPERLAPRGADLHTRHPCDADFGSLM
jgi:hypothetical protein